MRLQQFLFFLLRPIFFIPHLVLLFFSRTKRDVLEDVVRCLPKELQTWPILSSLIWLLEHDEYFRKLFYYRLGRKSLLVSWYAPGSKTFIFSCKKIGRGFYAAHPFSTIINAKSIGHGFSVRQCTTIGNKIDGRNDLVPTIGDNVSVGANAVIIGDIKIGNNVVIGAGSVVIHNVPDNSVVAGNPARIIRTLK